MVRQERGARAAFKHGADARGGESPMDSTLDQRRHHGDHRFGGAAARRGAQVYRSDVVHGVQLHPGAHGVHTVRGLVPAALRDGGGVGAGGGVGGAMIHYPSLTRRSRNQTGWDIDAKTRRRGENAEEDEGKSTADNAESAERRGLTPGEFPRKLAPISECSGRRASIGRGRWARKYSA